MVLESDAVVFASIPICSSLSRYTVSFPVWKRIPQKRPWDLHLMVRAYGCQWSSMSERC